MKITTAGLTLRSIAYLHLCLRRSDDDMKIYEAEVRQAVLVGSSMRQLESQRLSYFQLISNQS